MFAARARKCFVVMLAVTVGGLACFTAFSYLPALAVQKHRARAQLHATTQAPPPDATQSDFDNDSATATLPSYGDSSSSAQHGGQQRHPYPLDDLHLHTSTEETSSIYSVVESRGYECGKKKPLN